MFKRSWLSENNFASYLNYYVEIKSRTRFLNCQILLAASGYFEPLKLFFAMVNLVVSN